MSTSGTASVSTVFGSVADFFAGSTIDQTGELYIFAPYATADVIPVSASDDYVGLAFTLMDGIHYGYAEVDGPNLIGIAYQSTPGASITTEPISAALSTTPEPSSFLLLGTGICGLVGVVRKRLG